MKKFPIPKIRPLEKMRLYALLKSNQSLSEGKDLDDILKYAV